MKRQIVTFGRIITSGSKNFLRNAWLSSAAILVMTITLVVLSFTAVAYRASSLTIKKVAEKIDISLFVKEDVADADARRIVEKIEAISGVTKVEYIDRNTVFEQEKAKATKNNDQLKLKGYEQAGVSSVYATIHVKTDDPEKLSAIKNELARKEIADILDANDSDASQKQNETINNVTRMAGFLRKFGLVVSAVFMIISTILIFNTIRMTIFNRRDEIEVMRLIGASAWYIRGPFLVEASLYGFVASILTGGIVYSALSGSTRLNNFIEIEPVVNLVKSYPLIAYGSILLVGVIIGMFSAFLAIRRYIKFKVY